MEIYQIHAFVWIKGRRMMWEKNKEVTPRLAFPVFLKTPIKKNSFQKKEKMHFYYYGIKENFLKMFPG